MPAPLPTLTVVVPCYNGLPFALQAVESVVAAADGGVRCVVVDDGSTDGTGDAVARRFGPRVAVLRQPNGGVAAARNRGLAAADTDLVAWLDADDFLPPDTVALRRRAFADDPRLEMLVGQNRIWNVDTGAEAVFPRPPVDAGYFEAGLLSRQNLPHTNVLTFRRAALDRIGAFDPRFRTAEDLDLWVRAWVQLNWRFVPEVVSVQRTGAYPSLTRRNGKVRNYLDVGRVLRQNRPLLHRHFGTDAPWRRAWGRWATDLALVYLLHGRRREAARWAAVAAVDGRGWSGPRPYKYLLEAVVSEPVYAAASAAVRRGLAAVGGGGHAGRR